MKSTVEQGVQMNGQEMLSLAADLFPICRSITGDGLRETLHRIGNEIPIQVEEVRSGTKVLDWKVPEEWNTTEAWIAKDDGTRVVDFADHNLHLVSYSTRFRGRLGWEELKPHLFSLPDRPEWIPYRTTYYKRDWGFCLTHRTLEQLGHGTYEVCVDTTLKAGALSYGELVLPGETEQEFLFSAHCCHPSLANDNLSGIVVAVSLAKALLQRERRRLTYRFIFAPGTIGAITWLARNEPVVPRIRHGLVLTCVGDNAGFNYKRSRTGTAEIDEIMGQVLLRCGEPYSIHDFSPYGYDERQFCSPGFNLPFGCLMRSQWGQFPEYHTSADNLAFIDAASLERSLQVLERVVEAAEGTAHLHGRRITGSAQIPKSADTPADSRRFLNLKAKGEPQLGRYGVYEALDGNIMPALWVLNLSDGQHSLHEIAVRSGLSFDSIAKAADVLGAVKLIKEIDFSE